MSHLSAPAQELSSAIAAPPLGAVAAAPETRFDRRLSEIIDYAAQVFAEKGYEGASMRDLSRLSGTSLAGLYYYFESKEKLLYFIQKHTFQSILGRLRARLAGSTRPEERIRIFILNHIEYSVERPSAMKVLSHEDDVLQDSYGSELASIKREYYRVCVAMVDDFVRHEGLLEREFNTRTAVMALFGTMNWLYTWYNPELDPPPAELAKQIGDMFLQGIGGGHDQRATSTPQASVRTSSNPKQMPGPRRMHRAARVQKQS